MTDVLPQRDEDSPADVPQSPKRPSWGWLRWFWRTLTSMRTAIILLALLALAAVPGSLLPQRNVASDPAAVIFFIKDHPTLSPWLDRLGLFNVYASPWFAAIYLLLLVSMMGCVIPRCRTLWRSSRTPPPRAPTNLARLDEHRRWETDRPPGDVLDDAAAALRRRRFRVIVERDQVRAERGYLREVGNLVFHLSLLVLLVGIALDSLFGFEGRVAVAEENSFTNVPSQYDAFTPSVWTDLDGLEPFSFRLDDFEVEYQMRGPERGAPRDFTAELTYRTDDGQPTTVEVEPNHPLDVNETKVFLTGHGYAPRVTVRDGRGRVVFTGPVIFLPLDASYASDGVVKAPDARPTQLGFEGFFLPTAAFGPQGPYSTFPDALNPQLVLTAFTGDLGLSDGQPQSVYTLDKSGLTQVTQDGEPFARALAVGETMRLPGGAGSLTFDGVARFGNFQVAYDPGKEVSLVAAIMLLVGLTASLIIRRRRLWVRVIDKASQTTPRSIVEVAGLPLTRRGSPEGEIDRLLSSIGAPVHTAESTEETS